MKYRVKTGFLGVYLRKDGSSEFIQLQPGMVFALRGDDHEGMVKIMCDRRLVAVFRKDVDQRAVMLDAPARDEA